MFPASGIEGNDVRRKLNKAGLLLNGTTINESMAVIVDDSYKEGCHGRSKIMKCCQGSGRRFETKRKPALSSSSRAWASVIL